MNCENLFAHYFSLPSYEIFVHAYSGTAEEIIIHTKYRYLNQVLEGCHSILAKNVISKALFLSTFRGYP